MCAIYLLFPFFPIKEGATRAAAAVYSHAGGYASVRRGQGSPSVAVLSYIRPVHPPHHTAFRSLNVNRRVWAIQMCSCLLGCSRTLWFNVYNWFCRLTWMNDALANASVCDTGACSSSTRPLSHSSAVMKVQHSSSSFSFTVLFSYKACTLKSSQEERKPKEPQQRARQGVRPGKTTRRSLHSYYLSVTQLDHSRNIM